MLMPSAVPPSLPAWLPCALLLSVPALEEVDEPLELPESVPVEALLPADELEEDETVVATVLDPPLPPPPPTDCAKMPAAEAPSVLT